MKHYFVNNEETKAISGYGRRFGNHPDGIREIDIKDIMSANLFVSEKDDPTAVAEELLKSYSRVYSQKEIDELASKLSFDYKIKVYSEIEKQRNFEISIANYRSSQHQKIALIRNMLVHIHIEEDDEFIEGYLHNLFREVEDLKRRLKKVRGDNYES